VTATDFDIPVSFRRSRVLSPPLFRRDSPISRPAPEIVAPTGATSNSPSGRGPGSGVWTFDLQIALAAAARGTRALPGRASFDQSPGQAVSISQVAQSERSDSLGAHASRVLFGRTFGATKADRRAFKAAQPFAMRGFVHLSPEKPRSPDLSRKTSHHVQWQWRQPEHQ
jgi:hypothetical protein